MTILSVDNVVKRFGGLTAVDGVSFTVEKGEVRGIIGPNGSGKSTVFALISGIQKPDSGLISFNGKSITGAAPDRIARSGLVRTFQEIQLFYDMTVLENAMVGAQSLGQSGILGGMARPPSTVREEKMLRERALECLAMLGLAPYAGAYARTIPYGHQRLLEIARALASKPALLLLDEPAAGMNQAETLQLSRYIEQICALGITVLLVEHNMRMIMSLCSRITVLAQGRVIADGTPSSVQRDGRVIEAYLGRPASP